MCAAIASVKMRATVDSGKKKNENQSEIGFRKTLRQHAFQIAGSLVLDWDEIEILNRNKPSPSKSETTTLVEEKRIAYNAWILSGRIKEMAEFELHLRHHPSDFAPSV